MNHVQILPDPYDKDASKRQLHDLECLFKDNYAIFNDDDDEEDDKDSIKMRENITTSSSIAK